MKKIIFINREPQIMMNKQEIENIFYSIYSK
jgi:hypothetical protein